LATNLTGPSFSLGPVSFVRSPRERRSCPRTTARAKPPDSAPFGAENASLLCLSQDCPETTPRKQPPRSRRPLACNSDCTRFQVKPFPWARTSFRPRHTLPNAAASVPPSRSNALRAKAATAECSGRTRRLRHAMLPNCSPSPKGGCRPACRIPRRADDCSPQPISNRFDLADFRFARMHRD
jgi:hypothetical protein